MILLSLFLATQAVDAWSTWQVFRRGTGVEANPIVAALIARFGLFWALAVAKGAAIAAVAVGQFYGVWDGDLGQGALIALIGFYGWVCWNNLRILYGNPRT